MEEVASVAVPSDFRHIVVPKQIEMVSNTFFVGIYVSIYLHVLSFRVTCINQWLQHSEGLIYPPGPLDLL